MNADPTLAGFEHALTEYDDRVFIGQEPEKITALRERPAESVRSVRIGPVASSSAPAVFDVDVPLNPGFVAVVGNKGMGKSALLDAIGLAADTSNEGHFSFLTSERFRNALSGAASEYRVELEWANGVKSSKVLHESASAERADTVTYLPQRLIDEICSADPGPAEKFAQHLKAVLFSHVSQADRLGASDLDSLVATRVAAIRDAVSVLRGELAVINRKIVDLDRKLQPSYRRSLTGELESLRGKLEDLDAATPPDPGSPPVAADPSLDEVRREIAAVRETQASLQQELGNLTVEDAGLAVELDAGAQVLKAIETLSHQVETFLVSNRERFETLGIRGEELVRLETHLDALNASLAKREARRLEIAAALDPKQPGSAASELVRMTEQIQELEARLDEPQRQHAIALQERARWAEARRGLMEGAHGVQGIGEKERALAEIEAAPALLAQLRQDRTEKSRAIHQALREIVGVYEELYAPAREFIRLHPLAARTELEFGADLRESGFEDRFWSVVARNIAGSFFGFEEGAAELRRRLEGADFGQEASALSFINGIDHALHNDLRSQPASAVVLERAIRKGHSAEELLNLVFGFEFLEPYYVLQRSGKPIDQLSPGEKGTLLLMFYLLVDLNRLPLVLDQPDENLDNQTIHELLVPAIKEAKRRRQLIVVTHNPNVAIVADADQLVAASFDGSKFSYRGGAIESPSVNATAIDVLEGTWPAFKNRQAKYRPLP